MCPMGISRTSPFASWFVKGESAVSTRRCTCLQMYLSPAFRIKAPGQQTGLGQDLKPVADAQHQAATRGKLLHRTHHRRKARNGAGAEIVAVGKAAGNQYRIHPLQVFGIMPQKGDRLVGDLGDHVVRIVIAIRARKNEDAEFHEYRVTVSRAALIRLSPYLGRWNRETGGQSRRCSHTAPTSRFLQFE